MAISVQMGLPFLGLPTVAGTAIILDWELDLNTTLSRLYRVARGMGLNCIPPVHYQSLSSPLAAQLPDLITWCENVNPSLVCVDSQGPASGGDPLDHGKAIELMSKLRLIKCASMVVDHQSKPNGAQSYSAKRAFGSGYKGFLSRSNLQIEMVTNVPGKASVVLRQDKNNFGPKMDPIAFHVLFDGPNIRFDIAEVGDAEFKATEALPTYLRIERNIQESGPQGKEILMAECGIEHEQTFHNAITRLRSLGKIPKDTERQEGGTRLYRLC